MPKLTTRIATALLPDKLFKSTALAAAAGIAGVDALRKRDFNGALAMGMVGATALGAGAVADLLDVKDVFVPSK
jgi:hypothetical protein